MKTRLVPRCAPTTRTIAFLNIASSLLALFIILTGARDEPFYTFRVADLLLHVVESGCLVLFFAWFAGWLVASLVRKTFPWWMGLLLFAPVILSIWLYDDATGYIFDLHNHAELMRSIRGE